MWPFDKKRAAPPGAFHAKDGQAFFEMQCKYGRLDLRRNQANVAIVLDARNVLGEREPVRISDAGCQVAVLRVADEDGGFITVSQTPSEKGDRLAPGDLVLWVPIEQEAAGLAGDPRTKWVGLIRAKIPPEANLAGPQKITCRYD